MSFALNLSMVYRSVCANITMASLWQLTNDRTNNIDSLLKEYGYNGMNAIVMNGNGLAQMNVMNGMNAIVMNGLAMNQMN